MKMPDKKQQTVDNIDTDSISVFNVFNIYRLCRSTNGGMEKIVQMFVNASKVELTYIKITDATPSSFVIALEGQVTNTGPFGATIAPMTIDLIGPSGCFGKLRLPEQKTTSKGYTLRVDPQQVSIIDLDAFLAFVKATQTQKAAKLTLDNGHTKIKTMGLTINITFRKEMEMIGMDGPRTEFVHADGDKITAKIHNPSPLEMDLEEAIFECRNREGKVLAKMAGSIYVARGESHHEVAMTVEAESAGDVSELRMVGVDVKQESWMKEGIKFYQVQVEVTEALANLIRTKESEIKTRSAGGV